MKINDIFESADGIFPREALELCQDGKAYISEIDPQEGHRRFQIVAVPEPTEEEKAAALQAQYTALVQSILDTKAQKLGYDNCNSVCTYVDTGVQKFDDEGRAFRAWRSAVWAKGYEILDAVKAGEMAIPTEEELVEMLPKLVIAYSEVVAE